LYRLLHLLLLHLLSTCPQRSVQDLDHRSTPQILQHAVSVAANIAALQGTQAHQQQSSSRYCRAAFSKSQRILYNIAYAASNQITFCFIMVH
jgi:hypothetical protein